MSFTLLHLNVERSKHIDAVKSLLVSSKPDVVCLAEAMHKDMELLASSLGYNLAYAPRVVLGEGVEADQEGSVILSKFPILNIKKSRYDDSTLGNPPVYKDGDPGAGKSERPKDRFQDHYNFLNILIQLEDGKTITISTTHFPVTDHTTPGYQDHAIRDFQNVYDMERSQALLDKLINFINSVNGPLVFTADLNNARGEYFYDALAHELVDRVPTSLKSSIDPKLHRIKHLELMVDTIMTTPDVTVEKFDVVEGVSDHKAFLVNLNINK
jgi:endonuclease/exonuclease/phosphatase family metal-dependent hydrolase